MRQEYHTSSQPNGKKKTATIEVYSFIKLKSHIFVTLTTFWTICLSQWWSLPTIKGGGGAKGSKFPILNIVKKYWTKSLKVGGAGGLQTGLDPTHAVKWLGCNIFPSIHPFLSYSLRPKPPDNGPRFPLSFLLIQFGSTYNILEVVNNVYYKHAKSWCEMFYILGYRKK
jgi:hypothetical protein